MADLGDIGCCNCFGFLRKPRVPFRQPRNTGATLSEDLLKRQSTEDPDGSFYTGDDPDGSLYNGDDLGRSFYNEDDPGRSFYDRDDNDDLDGGDDGPPKKSSEDIIRSRAENGFVCREMLVKETKKVFRSEDENGNKMIIEASIPFLVIEQSSILSRFKRASVFNQANRFRIHSVCFSSCTHNKMTKESMKLLSLVLVLFGCLQSFVAADYQVEALYEMRMQLNDSRGILENWKENQMSPCYWVYIDCQDSNVISITMSSSRLTGVLSPSIAKLTTLQQLLLDDNSITGEIPEELGNLSSLKTLKLGRNVLTGSIPGSLGRLSNLQNLDLSQNYFNGNIPSSLSNLPSLNDINLADNNLSGEIPKQLLEVAQYNYTGNHLNCGQHLFSCEGGSTRTVGLRNSKLWIIATAVPLLVASICFILCFGWIRKHRKGNMSLRDRLKMNVHRDEVLEWDIEQSNSELKIFEFSEVFEATKEFSEENKLGQGGFGPVYKGQFIDGLEIAVKRLASCSGQGFREFKNEVQLIAKLQHRNLVRLLGCCSQGEEKMLVYEYLANKSLDFFIFDETRRVLLSWSRRLIIIEGIAQGLLYLHKYSRLRVIHRDIKASNILLDSEMKPKISDFGLARMFSSDDTDGNTKRVVGTYGYMAPEYASQGLFSTKSDVFSFGVLILEIVVGKRNSDFHQCQDFLNLLGYAWHMWREGRWLELVDASLVAECHHTSQMMKCINIALLCVQETAADRPTMSDVIAMLSSESTTLSEPKHPAYFHVRVATEETPISAELCSANGVTISSPRGR